MAYNLTLNNQQLQLSLARTGGQGSQGNSVTSASIDSNGDFHIIISNASGQQVQDINLGGANIVASVTAAKNAAEAALDTFDDRFLGVKSSAPGLDNDNDALVTGALYFDSTISHLGVYNGSTWIYPLQAAQTSATAAAASETAAATSETNAGTSETNAATSATNAANSAAQAASSESTVAASATTASTAATNALASQSAAATSEANAATSETNAGTSETNAGNSATSAASDATYSNNRANAAAASAAAALVSENNSATSESSAASSATTAGNHSSNAAANAISAANSKTAAASSESNALNYQSGAQTAETNASNSATASANSATAAATSETNAASSATSAATSLASVQTVFDNFDDKFLGTKSSDPTVDNDGDALVEGAMYYNSTTDVIKFYNGTSWEAPSTAASNSATAAATSATNAASSATNSASSATASANSAAASLTSANNAAASYDSFDDRYLGAKASDPTVDNDGDALVTGAIYFDSTNDVMKVYNGTDWQNASSSIEGIKTDFIYTATANQTVFSGSDNNSNILAIDKAGLLSLFMNGIRLIQGTDYTVNVGGDSVTLTSGAAVSDVIEIQVFGNFTGQSGAEVAITGGSITGLSNLGMSGSTTVTGILDEDNMASNSDVKLATQQSIKAYVDAQVNTVDTLAEVLGNGNTTGGTDIAVSTGDNITFADSSKATFGAGPDLEIYHDGSHSYISDTGTGHLKILANSLLVQNPSGHNRIFADQSGPVNLYHGAAAGPKLATTTTGVDITGTLVSDGLTVDGTGVVGTFSSSNNNTVLRVKGNGATNGGAIGSTSADDLVLLSGLTEKMRIDSSGNVGIGITPESWVTGYAGKVLQIGDAAVFGGSTNDSMSYMLANAYYDSVNSRWEYINTDFATRYEQLDGEHIFYTTASGTADAAITWSESMRIDGSGNVGIGTDSPASDAQLSISAPEAPHIYFERSNSARYDSAIGMPSAGDLAFYLGANSATVSGLSERMRITSAGRVGIGTDSPGGKLAVFDSSAATFRLETPGVIAISHSFDGTDYTINNNDGSSGHAIIFGTKTSGGESMRITSAGELLVGNISTILDSQENEEQGVDIRPEGFVKISRSSNHPLQLARTDAGELVKFRSNEVTVGSIGTHSPDRFFLAGASYGIAFDTGDTSMLPTTNTGGGTNGQVDLGKSDARWRSLHLSESIISSGIKQTTAATTQVIIETFAHASYDGAKVVITAATSADTYVTELLIATNGTTAVATEYGQIGTGSALATYDVDISGANVRILATPASTTSTTFRVAMTLT